MDLEGFRQDLAISPDGTQVVYKGDTPGGTAPQLNLRPIDQLGGAPLRGGEGGEGRLSRPTASGSGLLTLRVEQPFRRSLSSAGRLSA